MIIQLSGRCLSRAWLAVSTAASSDLDAPFGRSVRVEAHPTGVRLIALDGYLGAWCWVPAWDEMQTTDFPAGDGTDAEPIDLVPTYAVTVRDTDLRVRDLMAHIKTETSKKDSLDLPVEVDLAAVILSDPFSLFPEMTDPGARFELNTRERVVVPLVEMEYVNWRAIARRHIDGTPGAPGAVRTVLGTDHTARLVRIAMFAGAGGINFDRPDDQSTAVLWSIAGQAKLAHTPTGVMTIVRSTAEHAKDPVVHEGEFVDTDGVTRTDLVEGTVDAGSPVPSTASDTAAAARRKRAAARSRATKKGVSK